MIEGEITSLIVRLFQEGQSAVFSLPGWQAFLVVSIVSLLTAKVVEVTSLVVVEYCLSLLGVKLEDQIISRLHDPLYASVALVGLYTASLFLALPDSFNSINQDVILTLLILLWARALKQIGDVIADESFQTPMDKEFVPIFQNIWRVTLSLATLSTLLVLWQVNVTPFLASAGLLGITVGFAARGTIANFVGSVALFFDETYRMGDYIELETGEEGTVVDVGIRSTVLRTRDGNHVTIPNSEMNSTIIKNESSPQKRRRFSIEVGVPYGSDTETVEEILREASQSTEKTTDEHTPTVRLEEFGNSSLQYEILCWTKRPRTVPAAKHEVHTAIYTALQEEGIEIPYPQRNVLVESDSDSPSKDDDPLV